MRTASTACLHNGRPQPVGMCRPLSRKGFVKDLLLKGIREERPEPASKTCRRMRLKWFGHVVREGEGSASFKAYQMARDISGIRRRRGRPQTRWVDVVRNDLDKVGLGLDTAEQAAADKKTWGDIVDQCLKAWD